jgi:hypothetical protein
MLSTREEQKMKLLKIIIPILILSSCSGNIHTVRTKINKEIDPQLRNEINLIQITLIEGIKNKEYQNVLKLLSPKLKESKKFNITLLSANYKYY